MLVYKFGGTSVGTPDRLKTIAEICTSDSKQKVVVLSAISGTTDMLINLSRVSQSEGELILRDAQMRYEKYFHELLQTKEGINQASSIVSGTFDLIRESLQTSPPRDQSWFVAFGELLSTSLFSLYLNEKEVSSMLMPALDFMRTSSGEPDLNVISSLLKPQIAANPGVQIFITQGYICRNEFGEIDNLKRGGSDYTATIIGAVVQAEEIQIWTDIDGVHNNDPRIVTSTRRVDELTFSEAAELAYFGAKILHPLCVRPARQRGVPIRLLNTMDPTAKGTVIKSEGISAVRGAKAVAAKDGITSITIRSSYMLMAYGFLRKIFEIFEQHKTSVDMITTSEVAVSLTIDDAGQLDNIVADLEQYGTITVEKNQTIICVVGSFKKGDAGIAVQVLQPLQNIPIRMISSGGSESNISVLIETQYKNEALHALHEGLFITSTNE